MYTPHKLGSGLCVPCSVQETMDKGLGVFAQANVPKGTTVWRHKPGLYEVLDEVGLLALLATLSHEDAVYVLTHVVSMDEFPGYVVRFFDEGALLNHGEHPNVARKPVNSLSVSDELRSTEAVTKALCDDRFDLVASREIRVGDELLMDYNAEPDDPAFLEAAFSRYGVNWEWLDD